MDDDQLETLIKSINDKIIELNQLENEINEQAARLKQPDLRRETLNRIAMHREKLIKSISKDPS